METIDAELLRLVNVVREHKHQPPIAELHDDLRLREDLNFESLDLAELTVRLEERFGLDVFKDGIIGRAGELRERLYRHAQSKH